MVFHAFEPIPLEQLMSRETTVAAWARFEILTSLQEVSTQVAGPQKVWALHNDVSSEASSPDIRTHVREEIKHGGHTPQGCRDPRLGYRVLDVRIHCPACRPADFIYCLDAKARGVRRGVQALDGRDMPFPGHRYLGPSRHLETRMPYV